MANVLTVADFWSSDRCDAVVKQCEKMGFPVSDMKEEGSSVDPNHSHQKIVFEDESLAIDVWNEVKGYVPMKIEESLAAGVSEEFRIYKSDANQRFKTHRDTNIVRPDEASLYTLMISLNDNFEGGEVQFEKFAVPPEKGTCLLFLHELEHASKPVLAGSKYVICTDVMYRNFG